MEKISQRRSRNPTLSVVVPVYNEETSLPVFFPALLKQLQKSISNSYEVIVVNDGSKDNSPKIIKKFCVKDKNIKLLNLSRNFGKEIAVTAGIFQAKGEAILMIDADGQHPVELIGKFIKAWQDGNQVVIGVRKSNQKEGLIKRYGSKLFYKLFNSITDAPIIPGATDFRLIDKVVREEFMQFTERNRMARGVIDWIGFQRIVIPFHANNRIGGKASYKVTGLIKLALNSFVSSSVMPLYVIGYTGILTVAVSFSLGVFVVVEQFLLHDPWNLQVSGSAMIGVLTMFLVGITLIAQGLLAIYLSHIHAQTQNRPLFIVDKKNSVNLT